MLPKTSAFVRSYDNETKFWILVKNVELLEKNTDYLIKVSNSIKKRQDCKSFDIKSVLRTTIKSYGDEATDFHSKNIPEAGSKIKCFGQ